MELRRFMETLGRWWPIPLALLLLGVGGGYTYDRVTRQDEAVATVAVLDPLTARPGSFTAAQITFDQVVKSTTLRDRVAAKFGVSSDSLKNSITATLASSEVANLSPLYQVKGDAKSGPEAIRLTNLIVQEAKALYLEENSSDVAGIRASLKDEYTRANDDLALAEKNLNDFQKANGAVDLPLKLAHQADLVAGLRSSYYGLRASETAAYLPHRASDQIKADLDVEQKELDRLIGLESQYTDLQLQVSSALTRLTQLHQSEETLIVGQLLPADSRVKVLDTATVQPNFLPRLLTYTLAVVLALIAGFTVIYILALVGRRESAEDVSQAMGVPVLVRVPGARS
jgi:capsular polysaccharide biosynthesis protein